MSSRNRSFIAVLVAIVLGLAVFGGLANKANAASDNAAIVVNHGNSVGDVCKADVPAPDGNVYFFFGYITHFVETSTGSVNLGCQLWGPALGYGLRLPGIIVDPNGHAILTENGVA